MFELWEAGRGPGQERSFAQPPVVAQMANCRHRRTELRRVECPACFSRLLLKVFECEIHTECTLAKPLPGIACCMQCPDRTPADEEAQTASAPEYVE
jgi:hypothetical protein